MRGRRGKRPTRNYYSDLEVGSSATSEEISKAFKRLAKQYHPDKRRQLGLPTPPQAALSFQRIREAYNKLSDPVQRGLHDIDLGLPDDVDAKIRSIVQMRKCQAIADVKMMREEVEAKIQYEQKRQGLVVLNARFGVLPERLPDSCPDRILSLSPSELYVDVTVPLQLLVERSILQLPVGTKSELTGFYDPLPFEDLPKCLDVQYMFQNKLHRICTHDYEPLDMPLRSHLVVQGLEELASSVEHFKRKQNRRRARRMWENVFATAVILLGGIMWSHRKLITYRCRDLALRPIRAEKLSDRGAVRSL